MANPYVLVPCRTDDCQARVQDWRVYCGTCRQDLAPAQRDEVAEAERIHYRERRAEASRESGRGR